MTSLIDTTDKEAQSKLGKICVIAGNGNFPYLLVESMAKNNTQFIVAGLNGFVEEKVKELAEVHGKFIEVFFSDFTKLVRIMRKEGVFTVIIIGGVNRKAVRLNNFYILKMLFRLIFFKKKNDGVFRIIFSEFEKKGFRVVGIQDAMPSLLAKNGLLTKTKPSAENEKDIEFSVKKCREFGKSDIGQSIVVKNQRILGTETLLGTDALMKEAFAAKNGEVGGIMVKLAKIGQEERGDIPAIGFKTIHQLIDTKLDGIVIDAGYKTIIEEKEKLSEFADDNGIFILAI
ncbi:MAG: UDP-2,3-diacylglucosamine diphosphatase LpxI [Chitinivibrionia bacterium]|nr:UDP-2,3-diacylglucosamine diphosphatase LpxI [Chitinivibrionia bacterium]